MVKIRRKPETIPSHLHAAVSIVKHGEHSPTTSKDAATARDCNNQDGGNAADTRRKPGEKAKKKWKQDDHGDRLEEGRPLQLRCSNRQ